MKKSTRKTCLHNLRNRELGLYRSLPRHDYKIFSNLFLSERRVYRKKQEFNSSSVITLEADRIYMKHFREVHSMINRNAIYTLPPSLFLNNPSERIVDADVFYLTSADEPSQLPASQLFIGLTDRHRLLVLEGNTGKFLKAFQLPVKGEGYKFSETGILRDNETFFVKGRVLTVPLPASRKPHFVIGIFGLTPLRFLRMFVLREEVFGPFNNVTLAQDLLIFVSSTNTITFYSLDDVLRRAEPVGDINVDPNAILRPNILITDPSACLYTIRAGSDNIELGGFPWHCLYKTPKQPNYRLESVASGCSVKLQNGQLRQTDPAQMEINVFFNQDEGGSLICVSEREVEKLFIRDGDDELALQLKRVWTVSIAQALREEEAITYTASGRKASGSWWTREEEEQYIHHVQYLSSIDALCIITYNETTFTSSSDNDEQESSGKAKLFIVDNSNGRIIKEILLEELWDNACEEHRIDLDDDTLAHIIKHRSGKHSCHVYGLTEIIEQDLADKTNSKKRRRNTRMKHEDKRKRTRQNATTKQ